MPHFSKIEPPATTLSVISI